MNAICGDIETALEMFNDIHPSWRNVISWNILISGHTLQGYVNEALKRLSIMQEESVQPNHINFKSVLSACNDAGLVDEGGKCFRAQSQWTPEINETLCLHGWYTWARWALAVAGSIGSYKRYSITSWCCFMRFLASACKIHGKVGLGKIAMDNLLQLELKHAGQLYCELMSNIYAT